MEDGLTIFITPFHASARDFHSLISKFFGWFLRPVLVLGKISETHTIMRISKKSRPNVIIATPEAPRPGNSRVKMLNTCMYAIKKRKKSPICANILVFVFDSNKLV